MRLTDDVALVGGGPVTGFGLSCDLDAHVYLLDGGGTHALIDCGMGTTSGVDRVLNWIDRDGYDPHQIERLLLTHYHTDHAGGAATYRQVLSLRVSIGKDAREALETADHEATQFNAGYAAGYFPEDYRFLPCDVDDPLSDGDVIELGRLRVTYLATPGHCAGHGSYLVTGGERAYLFAGDAVFASGALLLQPTPDCDIFASVGSLRRLAEVEFTALLPGHGSIVLDGGQTHVATALSAVDRLVLPKSLI